MLVDLLNIAPWLGHGDGLHKEVIVSTCALQPAARPIWPAVVGGKGGEEVPLEILQLPGQVPGPELDVQIGPMEVFGSIASESQLVGYPFPRRGDDLGKAYGVRRGGGPSIETALLSDEGEEQQGVKPIGLSLLHYQVV